MGFFSGIVDKVGDELSGAKSMVSSSTPFKKINSVYRDKTGITAKEEAEDAYNQAVKENTGALGEAKAWNMAERGALAEGINAKENVEKAALSSGATRGEAANMGSNAVQGEIQNALPGQMEKAAGYLQGEIEKAGQNYEKAMADANAKSELIGKVANIVGTGIGSLFGPIGGVVGSAVGSGIGALHQKNVASDERLKTNVMGISTGRAKYSPMVKRTELLNLKKCEEKDE
jgi:hypothetical protein